MTCWVVARQTQEICPFDGMEATAVETVNAIDVAVLAEYYAGLPRECGFHSQCKMTLIGDLRGKRVLDVDCRRGKGVIKLSDYVGQYGSAIGVDPSPEWIEIGLSFMDEAWRRNGLVRNNMDYRVAYPENLAVAGLRDGEFDMVFANSSINLAYDPPAAFAEFYRVLRPAGILMFDSVVAESERDMQVVAQARAMGNSIQAAPSRTELGRMLEDAGFFAPEYHEERAVAASMGFRDGVEVPVVETDEDVVFTKTTARVIKPRS